MATSAELRTTAQDERDALKKVQAAADFAIAGAAALAFLVAPPAGAVALVPAAIRWRTSREIAVQERLIEDPPRADFEVPAQPEFEQLDLRNVPNPLADYLQASVSACAYEDSMIRSVEKSLGAQERDQPDFSRQRAQDAGRFARHAAREWRRLARHQEELIELVNNPELVKAERTLWAESEGSFDTLRRSQPPTFLLEVIPVGIRPASPAEALSPAVAAWLFSVGASADAFRKWTSEGVANRHPFLSLWKPLQSNAETKARLAAAIEAEAGPLGIQD